MLNVEAAASFNIQHSTFNIHIRRLLPFLPLLLLTTASFAQLSFGGAANAIPQQELIKITGAVNQRTGDGVRGVVTATIESGWHINSNKPLDDFVIPSALVLDATTADLVSAEYPPHTVRSFTFSGGQKLAVYEGNDPHPVHRETEERRDVDQGQAALSGVQRQRLPAAA